MKSTIILPILLLALCLILCSVAASNAAQMGTAFTYQGQLIDTNSVANGSYDFAFMIYDANVDGQKLGSNIYKDNVNVVDGYFTTQLDFGSSLFNGDARWLEIGIRPGDLNDPNVYTALTPRQELTPSPYAIHAANGGLISIDGVANPGGNVDLVQQNAITITADNVAKTITIGESHSPRTDNPHQVNATQTGALVGVEGVTNPGGNVDFVQQNAISISSDNVAKTITFAETHSPRTDNPHQVTPAQIGALVSVDGVANPGGNVDFMVGSNMAIVPDHAANAITFSAGPTIKQVIRGTATFTSSQTSQTINFSPSIEPSKAIALVPNRAILTTTSGNQAWAIMTDLTANSITIEICKHSGSFKISFQIIEYF